MMAPFSDTLEVDGVVTCFSFSFINNLQINLAVASALREQKLEMDSQRIDEVDGIRKQMSADAEQQRKQLEASYEQRYVTVVFRWFV